jgi:hypothetical protein
MEFLMCARAFGSWLLRFFSVQRHLNTLRLLPGWQVITELPTEADLWPMATCSMTARLPPQAAHCPWVNSSECAICAMTDVCELPSRIAAPTPKVASST